LDKLSMMTSFNIYSCDITGSNKADIILSESEVIFHPSTNNILPKLLHIDIVAL